MLEYLVVGLVVVLLIVLGRMSILYLRAEQAAVIERGGKFHRCLSGGLHFIVPLLDRPRGLYWRSVEIGLDGAQRVVDRFRKRIDLRETLFEVPDVQAATADQVPFKLDVAICVGIADPQRAVYGQSHLPRTLAQTGAGFVQQAVAQLTAGALLTDLAGAAATAKSRVAPSLEKYGLQVTDLQIRSALPADEVRAAIEKKVAAETNKAATILEAEGAAEAALKEGRSKQQLEVLAAEAKRQAMALAAEAEADAIRKIAAAIDDPDRARHALAIRYLDVLKQMAGGSGSKIVFVPYDGGGFGGQMDLIRQALGTEPSGSD